MLHYPDYNHEFLMYCDGCKEGVGAVLAQEIDGVERIIECSGRGTSRTEAKWSTTDIELLALTFGCKKFRHYVEGHKFTLITDHRPLLGLFKSDQPVGSRRARHLFFVASFGCKIEARPDV